MMKKDSMIIYRKFYEAIKNLPENSRLEIYEAIFELGLNYKEVKLNGISKSFFDIIKPKIESNNKKAEAGIRSGKLGAEHGKKGGRPTANKPSINPQVKKTKPNDVKASVAESKEQDYTKWTAEDFRNDITKNQADYSNELLAEFFLNWSEKGRGGKMKFQLQKTWETKLRLRKWKLLNYSKIQTTKSSNNNYNKDSVVNLPLWNQ